MYQQPTNALKHHLREELRDHITAVLKERALPLPEDDGLLLRRRSPAHQAHSQDYSSALPARAADKRSPVHATRPVVPDGEASNGWWASPSSPPSAFAPLSKDMQRQVLIDQMHEVRLRRQAEERARVEEEARAELKLRKELQEMQGGGGGGAQRQWQQPAPQRLAAAVLEVDGEIERVLHEMQVLTRRLDLLRIKQSELYGGALAPAALAVVQDLFVYNEPSEEAHHQRKARGQHATAAAAALQQQQHQQHAEEEDEHEQDSEEDEANGAAQAALFALRRAASASSGEDWSDSREERADVSPDLAGGKSGSGSAGGTRSSPRQEELSINSFLEADSPDVFAAISAANRSANGSAEPPAREHDGRDDSGDDDSSSQEGSLVFRG